MEKNKIIISILFVLVGIGIGYAWGNNQAKTPQHGMHMMSEGMMMDNSKMGMGNAMKNMMSGLEGLSGDTFDKAFLSEMIMHHEGAVLMAEEALKYAKHQEIKNMASEIIEAQNKEIEQMKTWQKAWYAES